ncbi:MAG: helix-turn-helix transcriptional regulator [Bacteroidetes bacterium]|nr:helix-turn-helix transcriptional regulator [Bacteroidota bacterium]MBK7108248.1 helix-turn-helix transcriptional regulator [Bacteroidota bacterium]MBK8486327.1 helix-turn-helix transcriptional regulator [Bacteroidota bacterium]MBK8683110.1 helix-turn-helix transcriptional regulator [Bacteroidota bacterium]MBP9549426.1 helix-turn-helix transcriptional regulator [Chitinophagales bacterium]
MAKGADYIIQGTLQQSTLEKAASLMRAIAHPLRLKIIVLLDKNKTANVNKIYKLLNTEQSIVSQHLKIMRNADLVNTKRDGKFIHYSVNYTTIQQINTVLEKYRTK